MLDIKGFLAWDVSERVAHGGLEGFAKRVADIYEGLPMKQEGRMTVDVGGRSVSGTVDDFWRALNESNGRLFRQIASKLRVEFVDEDPYGNAQEMRAETRRSGVLRIFKGGSDHPFFSVEENWRFRAVHDYYTHIVHGEDFTLRGELRAYNTHSKLAPPMALPALYTEVVAQVCCAIVSGGEFPVQKMAVVPGADYRTVGVLAG